MRRADRSWPGQVAGGVWTDSRDLAPRLRLGVAGPRLVRWLHGGAGSLAHRGFPPRRRHRGTPPSDIGTGVNSPPWKAHARHRPDAATVSPSGVLARSV